MCAILLFPPRQGLTEGAKHLFPKPKELHNLRRVDTKLAFVANVLAFVVENKYPASASEPHLRRVGEARVRASAPMTFRE